LAAAGADVCGVSRVFLFGWGRSIRSFRFVVRAWLHRRGRSRAHVRQCRAKSSAAPQLAKRPKKSPQFALDRTGGRVRSDALKTKAELIGDHYEVTGEKAFHHNAVPGRLIGLVVSSTEAGRSDRPNCRLRKMTSSSVHYASTPSSTPTYKGLKFNRFRGHAKTCSSRKSAMG